MADTLRTALWGSGEVDIHFRYEYSGDMNISVHETCCRLDAWEHKTVPAAELDVAEDPDGLIRDTAITMVRKCHIGREARQEAAG